MPKTTVTTIRMETELLKQTRKLAKNLDVSVSFLLRSMIEAFVRGDICIEKMKVKVTRTFAIQGKRGELVFYP